MIKKLIKTKSLLTPRKTAPRKLTLEKVSGKNREKINPQMENTFYVILVISLL